ncbi:hypothetical protein [Kineococcus sp. SYSU DK003]|uniref:hypothetical protein n=1 Tax=Kineococcus sp. SYSU DK003 TaxID=3383124 RepID=UPI003D7CFFD7
MRAGPSIPRRPLLLLPLALAACSSAPAGDGTGDGNGTGDGTGDEVRAALDARGRALLAGDLDAAGAGYAAADRDALRRTDGRAVAAGLAEWAVDGVRVSAGQVDGTLRVRVQGEGRAVAGSFRAGWDGRLQAATGAPQPWDLGDVTATVVEGGVVLQVGPGDDVGRQVATDLRGATRRVDAVWGPDWPRGTAVVVVPTAADVAELAAGAGQGLDAVAVGLDADLPDGRPAGVRVLLSTERFAALTQVGRRITLTHELVHVATRATRQVGVVPRWLTEGYADHVARLGEDVPATALAAALLMQPALPQVPADDDFTDAGTLPVAYAAAWTLVTSAARVAGTPAVTALVRAVRAGASVEDACRERLRRDFADVVATWRADVAGHLVGWGP